jgi:hypothetical protein
MSFILIKYMRSDRVIKTGATEPKSPNWRDDAMKKVAAILHSQAKKEDEINPKLKNYIRAVVYGAQQIHNLSYIVNGEVGNSLRDGDIVVLIDTLNNSVVMKKAGYEAITFDLVERIVKTREIEFDVGCGILKGVSDEIDLQNLRTDFTISERIAGDVIIDINMIKGKIDDIITMLNDIEGMIDDVQANVTNSTIAILAQIGATETNIKVRIGELETTIAGEFVNLTDTVTQGNISVKSLIQTETSELEEVIDDNAGALMAEIDNEADDTRAHIDEQISTVTAGIDDLSDVVITNIEQLNTDLSSKIQSVETDLTNRCNTIDSNLSTLTSDVAGKYTALKDELDEIKGLIQQLIDG